MNHSQLQRFWPAGLLALFLAGAPGCESAPPRLDPALAETAEESLEPDAPATTAEAAEELAEPVEAPLRDDSPELAPELAPDLAPGPDTAGVAEAAVAVAAPRLDPETIVLATLDDQPLTLADAMGAFRSSHTGHGALVQGEPAVRELVGRLIEQRLFMAEAEALGIPDSEEIGAAAEQHRRTLAERIFWRQAVEERVEVSNEDVEAFYSKTDVALSVTLIETEDSAAAEALHARVVAGEDMNALARESSIHESATFDGALTFVRRGVLDPALEEPAFAMEEPGSLTPVVQTEAGTSAFLRLEERIVNTIRPDREVALPQIRSILEERAEKALRAEMEERLAAEFDVEIDEALLTRDNLIATTTPEAVVARSAGETLTLAEFRDLLEPNAVRRASAEEVAEVAREIADEWAIARAVRRTPEYEALLEEPEVAESTADFREGLVTSMLYGQYVYSSIDPTEEQIRAYYEEHKDREYTRPVELRVAYLAVETDEEARDALRRIEAGAEFGNLARELSLDRSSALHGGRIGWVRPGQLLPEVEEVLFGLEIDDIGGPIETELGHFVVTVMDRKDAVELPYEMCRNAAREDLLVVLKRDARLDWARKLKERAAIRVDSEGIASAVAWLDEKAAEEAAAREATGPSSGSPHGAGGPLPEVSPQMGPVQPTTLPKAQIDSPALTEEGAHG